MTRDAFASLTGQFLRIIFTHAPYHDIYRIHQPLKAGSRQLHKKPCMPQQSGGRRWCQYHHTIMDLISDAFSIALLSLVSPPILFSIVNVHIGDLTITTTTPLKLLEALSFRNRTCASCAKCSVSGSGSPGYATLSRSLHPIRHRPSKSHQRQVALNAASILHAYPIPLTLGGSLPQARA